jgi:hypothetical protein
MSLYDRIDAALEKARWRKLEVRGIYLDEADYFAFAKAETDRWRKASGSKVRVYPMSYGNVLILGSGCSIVKPATRSRVYAKGGETIDIPKRLSAKVAA